MSLYFRSRVGCVWVMITITAASFLTDARLVVAQGSIACEYGPTDYRRCCTESYRNMPGLGARARAEDIDACMNRGSRDRDSNRNADPDRGSRAAKSGDASPPATLRRVECGSPGCPGGCAGDEIAVSAFCRVGAFPSPSGDRDVQCETTSGAERPTALVCAKK
jgi:hypothetical protein